jgi:hypothetical protein
VPHRFARYSIHKIREFISQDLRFEMALHLNSTE